MNIPKTFFEIVNDDNGGYNLIQRHRSTYHEDTLNPKKCVDRHTCWTSNFKIAEKLLEIFSSDPLTPEFLNRKYRDQRGHRLFWKERLETTSKEEIVYDKRYSGRCYNFFPLYCVGDSQVSCEQDLYNGTDQSFGFYYLIQKKNRTDRKEICRIWSEDYVPVVVIDWCVKNKIHNPFEL